jgi:hypothetical protein
VKDWTLNDAYLTVGLLPPVQSVPKKLLANGKIIKTDSCDRSPLNNVPSGNEYAITNVKARPAPYIASIVDCFNIRYTPAISCKGSSSPESKFVNVHG